MFHQFASICSDTYWTEHLKIVQSRGGTKSREVTGRLSKAAGCGQYCRKLRVYLCVCKCIFAWEILEMRTSNSWTSLFPVVEHAYTCHWHFSSIILGYIDEIPTSTWSRVAECSDWGKADKEFWLSVKWGKRVFLYNLWDIGIWGEDGADSAATQHFSPKWKYLFGHWNLSQSVGP